MNALQIMMGRKYQLYCGASIYVIGCQLPWLRLSKEELTRMLGASLVNMEVQGSA